MSIRSAKIIAGLGLVLILGAGYVVLSRTGLLSGLMDEAGLRTRIDALGLWGPAAVIVLMSGAIVFSPLPSAPIALAAGAAYGHLWGTAYVLVGAELGALAAFGIARVLGRDAVARWLGQRLPASRFTSQGSLMTMVLVSRLIPFISFDVVSYAAGLTPLTTWRFALATFAGILPASFLLAHFGDELGSTDPARVGLSVLLLGSLTLLPLAARFVLARRHRPDADDPAA